MSMTLCHTRVVHHEEVNLKIVCTCSLDLVMIGPNELDHLDTAALTGGGGGHVMLGISPIPGVMAPWVVPRVAVKTVNCVPGQAISSCPHCDWPETQ